MVKLHKLNINLSIIVNGNDLRSATKGITVFLLLLKMIIMCRTVNLISYFNNIHVVLVQINCVSNYTLSFEK